MTQRHLVFTSLTLHSTDFCISFSCNQFIALCFVVLTFPPWFWFIGLCSGCGDLPLHHPVWAPAKGTGAEWNRTHLLAGLFYLSMQQVYRSSPIIFNVKILRILAHKQWYQKNTHIRTFNYCIVIPLIYMMQTLCDITFSGLVSRTLLSVHTDVYFLSIFSVLLS